ncbi:MAG: LysM peptidoglycan-binding domain-containing protein [Bdellovibrionaceae bacterium]|jgi:hypothetical protein|nr:LysM peptidoglycan-binding domain-containing protein [Pseudobdellovibrionaceae bacterium]
MKLSLSLFVLLISLSIFLSISFEHKVFINAVHAQDDFDEAFGEESSDDFGGESSDDFDEFEDDDFETTKKTDGDQPAEDLEDEVKVAEEDTGDDETEKAEVEDPPPAEDPNLQEEEIAEEDIEQPEANPVEPEEEVVVENNIPDEVPPEIEEEPPQQIAQDELSRQPDDPNYQYEAKLYEIYVNYYKNPIPQQAWSKIIGQREKDSYKIQKGDSLWGISQVLFGDGHYWPKVWSKNGSIQNPHLISSGNSIHFLLGNEDSGPSFSIAENEKEENSSPELQIAKKPTDEENEYEIKLPPPSIESMPVLNVLPASLPNLVIKQDNSTYDEFGVANISGGKTKTKSVILVTNYIQETPIPSVGLVKEVESGLNSAARFQYVFVEFPKGATKIGEKYLVLENVGKLESGLDNEMLADKDMQGFVVEILGEIEIVDQVGYEDEDELERGQDIFRALVSQSYHLVKVGDRLVKGHVKMESSGSQGVDSEVVAQVIGGDGVHKNKRFGQSSLVYLNRGRSDGMEIGQILPVRSVRKLRFSDSLVRSQSKVIGKIKIVKTTPKYSTAVVVESSSFIEIGDLTGIGKLLPQNSPLKAKKSLAENLIDDLKDEREEQDSEDIAGEPEDIEGEELQTAQGKEPPTDESDELVDDSEQGDSSDDPIDDFDDTGDLEE